MDIQLFVSDLDGTLLNEHSQVAPETAQAIQRAQQAGIRWLTATGRSWNTAAPLPEQAGISCDFVLLNGAELRSAKGELLLDASLSTATARQAADILSKHGIGLEINTDQGDFTTDTQFCSAAPLPENFWSRPLTVRKLFGFCWDAAKPTAARQALGALNGVSITSSAPWNIEITAHEARKARRSNALRSCTVSIWTTSLSSATAAMTKACSEPFPIPARWKTLYHFCTHWRKK